MINNFDWCVYTYRHRRAFVYVVDRLIQDSELKEEMLRRAKVHDMDKMLMYLFLDQHESQNRHVEQQPHHLECQKDKTYYDLVETVIDYECAPYTKPDKPLNAYDFTNKLLEMKLITQETANSLIAIMHDFGIDSSYDTTKDVDGMNYVRQLGDVTQEMILKEVLQYLEDNDSPETSYVLQRMKSEL